MAHPFDPYLVFERSVEQWPDRTALQIGAQSWTYGQLHAIVLSYSSWCEANTKKPARVAVFGRKTIEAYAAILGILRSARSYVPLHPDHPPARWRTMLERAGISVGFITEQDLPLVHDLRQINWCTIPGKAERARSPSYIGDKAEAYIMFTSGSTGGPKGVPVGRTQVASYLQHQSGTYSFTPDDRFTQQFALSFDLSVHDMFTCWAAGGCLCVQKNDDPLRSAAFARDQQISVWFSVPSQIRLLRRMRALAPGSLPAIRYSFFCGEALTTEIASAWAQAAPESKLVNLYGPTEATIAVTAQEIDRQQLSVNGIVPIGHPFPGHAVLADDGRSLLPHGEGELLINGPQVNAGYLNDEAATARAFIPADDGYWYRTGDLVRIEHDGTIHFLGRLDDQVKIAGHRVEPAEVDHILTPLLDNGTSVTLVAGQEADARLITFIDTDADVDALFKQLRAQLPTYMIPDRIIQVGSFSHGAHGKLDKRVLLERLNEE